MEFWDRPEVAFAIQTVRRAALLVRQVQVEMVTATLTKDDRSPVTVADFASQALVAHDLAGAFPADVLVGEEDASALRQPGSAERLAQVTRFVGQVLTGIEANAVCAWIDHGSAEPGERYWTLDPIDGTKGFLRGDQYAVALALVEAGQVQVGVLGCPHMTSGSQPEIGGPGSLVVAVRGQGTWALPLNAKNSAPIRLHVSERADPRQARILRSVESGHTNISQIDEFAAALDAQAEPVRMDSQAKYAVLAAGRGDLLLRLLSPAKPNYREKIWDQAAGSLVVEEAGGRITDLDGKELDFTVGRTLARNRGVLASNGVMHEQAWQALRQIGA